MCCGCGCDCGAVASGHGICVRGAALRCAAPHTGLRKLRATRVRCSPAVRRLHERERLQIQPLVSGLVGGHRPSWPAVAALGALPSAQPVFTGAEIFPPEEFAARRAKVMEMTSIEVHASGQDIRRPARARDRRRRLPGRHG